MLWAEAFNLHPETSAEELYTGTSWEEQIINDQRNYPFNYTVVGLSKLLTYGSFVNSRASVAKMTVADVVREELDRYPYARKAEFKEPYFRPLNLSQIPDLSGKSELFREAIQWCHNFKVLTILATYSPFLGKIVIL